MRLGPIKILKNEKGFYLGKERWDRDFRKWFQHERHSEYFATAEEANNAYVNQVVAQLVKEG